MGAVKSLGSSASSATTPLFSGVGKGITGLGTGVGGGVQDLAKGAGDGLASMGEILPVAGVALGGLFLYTQMKSGNNPMEQLMEMKMLGSKRQRTA